MKLAQLVEDVSCIEEKDEVQGELFDDPDDMDCESQHTDVSDHDSDSEVDMDPTEGDMMVLQRQKWMTWSFI
nr:unnamed protein product [Callosobruchus analis]